MFHRFRLVPFLAGIAVGTCIILFYTAPKQIVFEYPHPQNLKERVYRDTKGKCYTYSAEEVDCDVNEGTLKAYPG